MHHVAINMLISFCQHTDDVEKVIFRNALSHVPIVSSFFANTATIINISLINVKLLTRLFQLVGDDTTYEVRLGGPQSGHQVVKLFLWV